MTPLASNPRAIAITGATGLVGRALCLAFADSGWTVHALARREDPGLSARGIRAYPCDLPTTLHPEALHGCAAVVHAAYSTRHRSMAEARRTNEEGSARIFEAARAAGARVIFVSSVSAHPRARSYYGQSKLRLEGLLDPGRDLAVRPGLVLSSHGGLFQRMAATVRRSPFIPLFGGGRQPIQTVHIDDLCAAFLAAADRGPTGTLTIAEPEPITLRRLLELFAARLGRSPRFLSVPISPALAALRVSEGLGLRLPASSENILGLLSLRAVDCRADLERLGVPIRPAPRSIADLPLARDPAPTFNPVPR